MDHHSNCTLQAAKEQFPSAINDLVSEAQAIASTGIATPAPKEYSSPKEFSSPKEYKEFSSSSPAVTTSRLTPTPPPALSHSLSLFKSCSTHT